MTGDQKIAYISTDKATLEINIHTTPPQVLITLDLGIPQYPFWTIRLPVDKTNAEVITDLGVQALAEDVMSYLQSHQIPEPVAKAVFICILGTYNEMKTNPTGEFEGENFNMRADFPLDELFVSSIQKHIVLTAAKIKTPPPKPQRRLELIQTPKPGSHALSEAQRIIQRYRGKALKNIGHNPLYVLIYNMHGQPVGVKKL